MSGLQVRAPPASSASPFRPNGVLRMTMRTLPGLAGATAIAALLLATTGCADQSIGQRGYVIDEKALAQIKVGSSAEQVLLVMGTPSTTSTVGGQTYYYISQKVSRPILALNDRITDQRVIAFYLDDKNRV
ncbi:MAG: outer membrane protein assembly factor BamE, partial [Methylobacterium sp.]|nr:outer membrane protein assembly factor BamE [Methylobacterium sp.]